MCKRRMLEMAGCISLGALSTCAPDSVAPSDYGAPETAGVATSPSSSASSTASGGAEPMPRPATGGSPSTPGDLPPSASGCDLSGRWLAVTRELSAASGAKTAAHEWLYLEIRQSGDSFSVTRGLSCGQDLVGVSALSASGEDRAVWPAMLSHCSQSGRGGTSRAVGSECAVTFERFYEVIGATVPHYLDPSRALPALSETASSTLPGWEDWDNDGKPGFTLNMSGLVTGKLYLASRRWTEWSGSVPIDAHGFTLAADWKSELSVLGYDGSSLLSEAASGTKDNDASQHFVTFARLASDQAVGDDDATCAGVRSLLPQLAAQASN